ncbi:MAG: hypothetical protein AAFZ09_18540 [Pseudomonadota bacterium]
MPFDFRAALAAAALALAPQGAAAVSMASSAVSWELSIVSPTPSGTDVDFDSLVEVVEVFADSDGLASSFAEASADPDDVEVIDTVDSAIDDAPIASGTSSSLVRSHKAVNSDIALPRTASSVRDTTWPVSTGNA